MSGFETSLVAAALFLGAAISALRAWRLSRWPKIDADVVHVHLVGPIGLSPTRFSQQLEAQRRGVAVIGPEIVHHAELVYVVGGVPYPAELTFAGPPAAPPDRKYPIRVDPHDPSDYTTEDPSYARAIALAAAGLAWTLHFLIRS